MWILGHSFTIIGAEQNARGNYLLVYDPSISADQVYQALASRSIEDLLFLRKPPTFFNRSAYQIVAIRGALSSESYELSKHFSDYNHTILSWVHLEQRFTKSFSVQFIFYVHNQMYSLWMMAFNISCQLPKKHGVIMIIISWKKGKEWIDMCKRNCK